MNQLRRHYCGYPYVRIPASDPVADLHHRIGDMIKILRSGNIRAPIDPAPAQGDQSAGNQKAYLSVPRKKPAGPIAENHPHRDGPQHPVISLPVQPCRHEGLAAHREKKQGRCQKGRIHQHQAHFFVFFRDQQENPHQKGQRQQRLKSRIQLKNHKTFHKYPVHKTPPDYTNSPWVRAT